MTDQPSAAAIAAVLRVAGKYRHGDPDDEAKALFIDAYAAQAVAASRQPQMAEEDVGRGWHIARDNTGKLVPVGRGLACGGWWWCPSAPDNNVDALPEGWTLVMSFDTASERASDGPTDVFHAECPHCHGKLDVIPSERAKPDAGDLERAKAALGKFNTRWTTGSGWTLAEIYEQCVTDVAAALAEARRAGESAMRERVARIVKKHAEHKSQGRDCIVQIIADIDALIPEAEGRS